MNQAEIHQKNATTIETAGATTRVLSSFLAEEHAAGQHDAALKTAASLLITRAIAAAMSKAGSKRRPSNKEISDLAKEALILEIATFMACTIGDDGFDADDANEEEGGPHD